MSAFGNFMNIFFPGVGRRRQEQALNDAYMRNLQALSPFTTQTVNQPFQTTEVYDEQDPLAQLQQNDPNALMSQITKQGLFSQPQAESFARLMANPQTAQFGQALLSQAMSPQGDQIEGQLKQFIQARQMGLIPENTGFLDFKKAGGTNINNIMGNDKPIGNDAATWTNKRGERPSPMDTVMTATQKGFYPETADQRKSTQSATEAGPIFGGLIKYGFGEDDQKSLFPPASMGAGKRAVEGLKSWAAGVTDSDLRISLYDSSKNAVVTGLARLAGQVGNLTDRDVDTVANLLPTAGLTPEPVAREKFKQIGNLLKAKGVPDNILAEMGFPKWAISGQIDLPPGYKVVK